MRLWMVLLVVGNLCACGADGMVEPDATPAIVGTELGSYEVTYYWLSLEDDYPGTKDADIYDSTCNLLATVTQTYSDSLKLEGSGKLSDGRVLNYEGSCGCATSPCYFEVEVTKPWGEGVQGRALVPFRSVAVDTDLIAIGTALYIAEFDGLTMPGETPVGGFVHDGCVVADDIGGAILETHIDFFAGLRSNYYDILDLYSSDTITLFEGGTLCL